MFKTIMIGISTLRFLKTWSRKMKLCPLSEMISSSHYKKLMQTLILFTIPTWTLKDWLILMQRSHYWYSSLTHLTKYCSLKEWTTRSLPVSEHLKSLTIWLVTHSKLYIKDSWLSKWIKQPNWRCQGVSCSIQLAKTSFRTMLKSSY